MAQRLLLEMVDHGCTFGGEIDYECKGMLYRGR
jgi:hypothetical protein